MYSMETERQSSSAFANENGDFVDIRECRRDRRNIKILKALQMAQMIHYSIEAAASVNEKVKDLKSLREFSY